MEEGKCQSLGTVEIRAWIRENHLLSPKFGFRDLEKILQVWANDGGRPVLEDVQGVVLRMCDFPKRNDGIDLRFVVMGIDEAKFLNDEVMHLVWENEKPIKKLFHRYSTVPEGGPIFAIHGENARCISLASFLECICSLDLNIRLGVASVNFRRSITASRLKNGLGGDNHAVLCYPEFVEALCRCVEDDLPKLMQRVSMITCDFLSPPASPQKHKQDKTFHDEKKQSPQQYADRPLTPRKRKDSSDMLKWPHVESPAVDMLNQLLDGETEMFDHDKFEHLLRTIRLSDQDIYVQQGLLPRLRWKLDAGDTSFLPYIVYLVTKQGRCADPSILPMDETSVLEFVENVIGLKPEDETACLRFFGYLLRDVHQEQHPMTEFALSSILNKDMIQRRVLAPLLLDELRNNKLQKQDIILCLGCCGGPKIAVDLIMREFSLGTVDPQFCAWALRRIEPMSLVDILRNPSPAFSAKSREWSCWALAQPNENVTAVGLQVIPRITPISEVNSRPIVSIETSRKEQVFDGASCLVKLSIDVRHVMSIFTSKYLQFGEEEFFTVYEEQAFVKAIVWSLRKDTEWNVRQAAAKGLGMFETLPHVVSDFAIGSLCDRATSDESELVRQECIGTLGKLADQFAFHDLGFEPEEEQAIVTSAMRLLDDSIWKVRVKAVWTLGRIGQRAIKYGAVEKIHSLMKTGTIMHQNAGVALARMGPKGAEAMLEIVQNKSLHAQARVSACHGLSHVFPTSLEIVAALYTSTNDSLATMRREGFLGLFRLTELKHREEIPALSMRVFHPKLYKGLNDLSLEKVGFTTAEILARFGGQGELLLVEGLLHHSSIRAKKACIHGLGKVGVKTIRSLLLAANISDDLVLDVRDTIETKLGVDAVNQHIKHLDAQMQNSVLESIKRAPIAIQSLFQLKM